VGLKLGLGLVLGLGLSLVLVIGLAYSTFRRGVSGIICRVPDV